METFKMQFNEKRLFLKLGLLYAAIHLILYLPVHISYQDFFADAPAGVQLALGIAVSVMSEAVSFILPLIAAAVLFISYAYRGLSHALPRVLLLSLPYIVSLLPDNYLKYLYYTDSAGAILTSVLLSLLTVIIITLEMLALFGVICFFCRLPKEQRAESRELSSLAKNEMFNFSLPFTKGLFAASLTVFAVRFITEAFSTVSYIISDAGSYRARELMTIVFTYLFITALFALSYIITYKIKSLLIESRLKKK